MERNRMANNIPVIFEVDYFAAQHEYILEADVEQELLSDIIWDNCNMKIIRNVSTFDVREASKIQTQWLQCDYKESLLHIEQIVYTTQNEVLYYNEQYIRSDIYKYVVG